MPYATSLNKMKEIAIHFLGGANTVTGSKFVIATPELTLMVDCGLFQGDKALRKLNWKDLSIAANTLDYVLLTHGHLDHTGYLPKLKKEGFKGQILGTAPTIEIAKIILTDSGKIQEELAEMANKEGFSKHRPALPLYTIQDAERVFPLFTIAELNQWMVLSPNIKCRFRYNGHILGATFIEVIIYGKHFVFSGDIGRPKDLLLDPPDTPDWADFLFLESTYGDRLHPNENVNQFFAELVLQTISNRGTLIIPTFAVERLQSVMYRLWQLYKRNQIPGIPIFVDSPMGKNVLELFQIFSTWHQLDNKEYLSMVRHFNIIQSYADTWKTIDDPRPKIVIAGSGMVTGGRVLTYLSQLLEYTTTTVALVGYQAEGTRGRKLLDGATHVKIFGKEYPVNAKIAHLESLSAHADQKELLSWLSNLKNFPEKVFLVHGEPQTLQRFQSKLQEELRWQCTIPKLFDVVTLPVAAPAN